MRHGDHVFKSVFTGIKIMEEILHSFLDKYDFKGRIIPAARLKDLENDFKRAAEVVPVDPRIMDVYLKNLFFTKPEAMESPGSIVVIAMARPAHRLGIVYGGKKMQVLIPPTYVNYQKVNRIVFNLFRKWTGEKGRNAYAARLPLKLLSVRSGLAVYGKNNISYIGKWGSFHQLFAFFTDIVTEDDPWQELKVLDACNTCDLCRNSCPTGAIMKDRFMLDAAKCLAFLNESESRMPSWVDPDAHNSLIGCMSCQEVCPYNNKVKGWIEEIGELDEDETRMLLELDSRNGRDPHMVKRTKELGIYEFFNGIIPRNLQLLLDKLKD
jgi:epoxyqueuosine reductase